MARELSPEKIREYFETHWENILREAEGICPPPPPTEEGTVLHLARVKDAFRSILVLRLEDLKGDWLYAIELAYTYDLFNARSERDDYFLGKRKRQEVGPPQAKVSDPPEGETAGVVPSEKAVNQWKGEPVTAPTLQNLKIQRNIKLSAAAAHETIAVQGIKPPPTEASNGSVTIQRFGGGPKAPPSSKT